MDTAAREACATVTPKLHEASLATLRDRYARISTVTEALRDLDLLSECTTAGILARRR